MMKSAETVHGETGQAIAQTATQTVSGSKAASLAGLFSLKRLRGGLLFGLGYLLSPLCWWNDLIFNLPVAYGFGYLCSLVSPNWLLPGLILGYWLSNVVGFVLMQFGAVDALQKNSQPRNPWKELLLGVASSTVYTLVILALVQFQILDPSSLLPGELFEQPGGALSNSLGQPQ